MWLDGSVGTAREQGRGSPVGCSQASHTLTEGQNLPMSWVQGMPLSPVKSETLQGNLVFLVMGPPSALLAFIHGGIQNRRVPGVSDFKPSPLI